VSEHAANGVENNARGFNRAREQLGGPRLRIDYGHSFDLDHEVGTGQAGDADSRAGRGGHPK
jgi:hypothetical protein